MNKVLEIKEVFNIEQANSFWNYDGYFVKTEKDTYYFLIENGQCCCEDWGYISSDEDLTKYIGKELVSIDIVDTGCNKILDILKENYVEENECMFINLNFGDMSELQLAVYNSHNGYYGHGVLFIKNDKTILDSSL